MDGQTDGKGIAINTMSIFYGLKYSSSTLTFNKVLILIRVSEQPV